jgi:hypothetical protein
MDEAPAEKPAEEPLSEVKMHRHEEQMVNDTTQCPHDFILKGVRQAECRSCGLGVFINGPKDYERITKR